MGEIESKISHVSGLVTTSRFTAVENRIPDVNSLVKKKKKIIAQKVVNLKRKLLTIIMIDVLLLQNLISLQQNLLM